jgi:hypothetical protein
MAKDLFKPEYPKDPKRQQAYTLYVVKAYTDTATCSEVGISLDKLQEWIDKDQWDEDRKQLCLRQRTSASEAMGAYVAERATRMIAHYATLHDNLLALFDGYTKEAVSRDRALTAGELKTIAAGLATTFGVGKGMLDMAGLGVRPPEDKDAGLSGAAIQVNILNQLHEAAARHREPDHNS